MSALHRAGVVVDGHAVQSATGPGLRTVRVDSKIRTSEPAGFPVSVEHLHFRKLAAKILDRVCENHGLSHAAIARRWQCSESYVRAVRSGEKPLTIEKLLALPKEEALAAVDALREQIETSGHEQSTVGSLHACAVAIGEAFHAHALGDQKELETFFREQSLFVMTNQK
jgi:hypothetical protein